ncbi:MAG: hypothetical protein WD766_08650 [Gemmatimonadota bacterium]
MQLPVLDEDLVRVVACREDAGDVDAGHVRQHRGGIEGGDSGFFVDLDAQIEQHPRVGDVPDHRQDPVVPERRALARFETLDLHLAGADLPHHVSPVAWDRALGDPIVDIRLHPRFHPAVQLLEQVDDRDPRPLAPARESRVRGRVPTADDDHVLVEVRVRLGEVVLDLRKVGPGNAERARIVVVAGSDDDVTGVEIPTYPLATDRVADECLGPPVDPGDFVILHDVEVMVADDATIVAERLPARRLIARRGERDAADFQLLRAAEVRRIRGVLHHRLGHRAAIDEDAAQPVLLRGHPDGDPARPRPDDDQVQRIRFRALT